MELYTTVPTCTPVKHQTTLVGGLHPREFARRRSSSYKSFPSGMPSAGQGGSQAEEERGVGRDGRRA